MPEARSARARPASRNVPLARPEAVLPALRVQYYRRVRTQRTHKVVVTWMKSERRGPEKAVTVRLLGAGAQILPHEARLDAADPEAQAVFFVTPLARGWLGDHRLEVLLGQRKVDEISLPAKAVTQRSTWVLLLLALFLPWLLTTYVKDSPLLETAGYDADGILVVRKNPLPLARTTELFLNENLPDLPDAVRQSVPALAQGYATTKREASLLYEYLHESCRDAHLAFHVGAFFFVLALLSAWTHRAKRKIRTTDPIPLVRPRGDDD